MPYHMKNASACALSSDSIYVFGGKLTQNGDIQLSDKILLYQVAANTWIQLPVRIPDALSLITPIKVNGY